MTRRRRAGIDPCVAVDVRDVAEAGGADGVWAVAPGIPVEAVRAVADADGVWAVARASRPRPSEPWPTRTACGRSPRASRPKPSWPWPTRTAQTACARSPVHRSRRGGAVADAGGADNEGAVEPCDRPGVCAMAHVSGADGARSACASRPRRPAVAEAGGTGACAGAPGTRVPTSTDRRAAGSAGPRGRHRRRMGVTVSGGRSDPREQPAPTATPINGDRPDRGKQPARTATPINGDRPDRGKQPARTATPINGDRPDRGNQPAGGAGPSAVTGRPAGAPAGCHHHSWSSLASMDRRWVRAHRSHTHTFPRRASTSRSQVSGGVPAVVPHCEQVTGAAGGSGVAAIPHRVGRRRRPTLRVVVRRGTGDAAATGAGAVSSDASGSDPVRRSTADRRATPADGGGSASPAAAAPSGDIGGASRDRGGSSSGYLVCVPGSIEKCCGPTGMDHPPAGLRRPPPPRAVAGHRGHGCDGRSRHVRCRAWVRLRPCGAGRADASAR